MAMDWSEIAFFDLETRLLPQREQKWTVPVPVPAEQKWTIVEFGVILICPKKLVELDSFCTLIRPADLSLIPEFKSNGITRDAVAKAPKFEEVADRIYNLLNGRVWAGHNIVNFDCELIRDAFVEIRRLPPKEKELIDSFPLLEDKFGRRAGDMKMATLANYFGLGNQEHRSLSDVRMNLEVLKRCATVLFLESNFPAAILSESPAASTSENLRKRKASTETVLEEKSDDFLEPHEISRDSLRTTFVPSQWGTHKMTLLHKDIPLRMRSCIMKIRFNGISRKFFYPTGKPRLSFVVEPSSDTCDVLKQCETLAQNLFSGCNDKSDWNPSDWKPLVTKKYGSNPVIRIHIETAGSGKTSTYSTDLYWRDSEGRTQRLASKTVDINELDKLFVSERSVDADYNFDIYELPATSRDPTCCQKIDCGLLK